MKNFISLRNYSTEELTELLDRADWLRDAWKNNKMPDVLKGKTVALWFYGQGFRNRVAFEIGAKAMGAHVSFIPGELGIHEPLEDMPAYLGNWFSMVVIRAGNHEGLLRFSLLSSIPVINARTDKSHPCEIMGDLQYVRRYRGEIEGLNLVFVGEPTNLCMSWFEAANVFPINVVQVCPEGYEVEDEVLSDLRKDAKGEISVTNDLETVVKRADVLYTDCWPKIRDENEKDKITSKFLSYQIQMKHLAAMGERGIFLPCPPVTRGKEVSFEAMKSPLCKNFEAKDNLLHIQNAIMEHVSNY